MGETIFVDAFTDTIKSFTAWTSAVTVTDFRSTIASVATFPELLAIPEHGEYVARSPFGPRPRCAARASVGSCDSAAKRCSATNIASFGQLQQALGVAAPSVENDVV